MSEEIVNNESGVTENNVTETNNQQSQLGASLGASLGGNVSGNIIGGISEQIGGVVSEIINPVVEKPTFEKIGRELKTKVTFLNNDSRNALGREVAEINRNKELKEAEKKALVDKFNQDLAELTAQIKNLEEQARYKSEMTVTGELRETVMCDKILTDTEVLYVVADSDPSVESNIIKRETNIINNTATE